MSGNQKIARVLSIAGTDPTGGAGTAADLKAIISAGGFGMAVITSLVAQNTQGVRSVHTPPIEFLKDQLKAVGDDVDLDGVKTGMLASCEIIETVSAWVDEHQPKVLVVDPVMVATSGDRLIDQAAENAMRQFCRKATVVTPNLGELAVLTGKQRAKTEQEALEQGLEWAKENATDVVVKLGHLENSPWASNYWVTKTGEVYKATSSRVNTKSTHGTGCSLASAIAARLAGGDNPQEALTWATNWLHEAIVYSSELHVGRGNGPVDHGHRNRRLAKAANTRPWLASFELPTQIHSPADIPQSSQALPPLSAQAAGPWTDALWKSSFSIWDDMRHGDFVRSLIAGDLNSEAFEFYLGQDSIYLHDYSRALAVVGAHADSTEAEIFWAQSAKDALANEHLLHEHWLGNKIPTHPGPVTSHYTSFLIATAYAQPYCVGAAGVLPCFWLYAETGAQLPNVEADHPYAQWLDTYREPEFVDQTATAIGFVEQAMEEASPIDRAKALNAYLLACHHEGEFFDQALRLL